MKARPVGDCFQSLAGRNSSFQIVKMNYHYMLCAPDGAAALHIVFQDLSHSRMVSGDLSIIRAISLMGTFASACCRAISFALVSAALRCRLPSFWMISLAI